MKRFNYSNVMQVPRLEKIAINVGVGQATQDPKLLDGVVKDLETIVGQKVVTTKAKKAVSNFKLREGLAIGARVTLGGGEEMLSVGHPEYVGNDLSVSGCPNHACPRGRGKIHQENLRAELGCKQAFQPASPRTGNAIWKRIGRHSDQAGEHILFWRPNQTSTVCKVWKSVDSSSELTVWYGACFAYCRIICARG